MHIHIHTLVHYARLLGNMRFLGTMLLMLLIGQLQPDSTKTASAMGMARATHHDRSVSMPEGPSVPGDWRDTGVPSAGKSAEAGPVPPDAMNTNAHPSVFHRPETGIVMVPRMNRTPKPKSVYRSSARSPGAPAVRVLFRRHARINFLSS